MLTLRFIDNRNFWSILICLALLTPPIYSVLKSVIDELENMLFKLQADISYIYAAESLKFLLI